MFSAKDTRLTRPSGAFVIPRSLRFRSSASAYLNRTFGTPTDVKTQTFSLWIKRGLLGNGAAEYYLLTSGSGGTECRLVFNTDDTFTVFLNNVTYRTTTQVFRDLSAWYHLVFVLDTANATANSRFLMYVNGVVVSSFSVNSAITQNATFSMFSAVAHNLCRRIATSADYLDGYLAEVNLVDGQALTPTSFGATSTTTGVWSPKKYTGTYGNNGFHLDFNSYATTAALGTDTSGNSNTWTVNGCSVTAGVTYDSMIDVPTVTATGSNYATLNGTIPTGTTYGQGNLFCTGTTQVGGYSSVAMTTGKFYAEVIFATGTNANMVGICNVTAASTDPTSAPSDVSGYGNVGYYALNGNKYIETTASAYGATYTTGDVLGIEVDMDNNTVQFFKNGTSQGTISTTINTIPKVFWSGNRSPAAHSENWNFGQTAFNRTPTAGFVGLNTYNLAAPSILKGNLYMDATTYTGTNASLGVTNAGGFQPDWVWIKSRSAAGSHSLYDVNRGVRVGLFTNVTSAESTEAAGFSMTAFNSNGFTVGLENAGSGSVNDNGTTYVGWQWKGGGAAVTNTSGSITSSVSASAASGFSVVTYTGTGANATVGHGLGVAPRMMIIKQRSGGASSGANDWNVYHANLTSAVYYIRLNLQNAEVSNATVWNSTAPSSTVFSLGSQQNSNELNGLMVAYCFAQIAGYSAFGGYVGNGSADGTFVYTGFRPRWIMTKQTDGVSEWDIIDTARDTYNLAGQGLRAHTSSAEYTPASSGFPVDILSNGFKWRVAAADPNRSGNTYIYAAFAENPFNNSLAR